MISNKTVPDYWFVLESYVYVGIADQHALLYNTLDGVSIESNKIEIIKLLQEVLKKENCGVVLLKNERYRLKEVNDFIRNVREKYMGDIIDIALSKGKPIQLLPFYNFFEPDIYKKHNFSPLKNVLRNLSEISVHVDPSVNLTKMIPFLQSVQGQPTFNIVGNIWSVENYNVLLSFFNQLSSPKYIVCSYNHMFAVESLYENNFSYIISVNFPLAIQKWDYSRRILLNQSLLFEYIFYISSDDDYQQAAQLIEKFQIEKFQLIPVYTESNIKFFEDNVYLTKDDILSSLLSVKDFFLRQSINMYDFGKINIMPNGDAYANVNHPILGNVFTHSLYQIIHKEVTDGESWFRVRNQAPCNNCVYQWICPHPSSLEITIGRPNLCHVK